MKSRRLVTLSQLTLLLAMSGGVEAKAPGKTGPEKSQPAKVLYLKGKQPKSKQAKAKPIITDKSVKTKPLKATQMASPRVVERSAGAERGKRQKSGPETRGAASRVKSSRPVVNRTTAVRRTVASPSSKQTSSARKNRLLVGKASWYSDALHGRPTASGKPYLKSRLTAAHKTLPLGTKVRVCRLHSQQCVVVVINDRGPFHKNRIIDLSRAAAAKLEMIRQGEAVVSIKQIET